MKKKIIITESQLERLSNIIKESSIHSTMVKTMKEDLDKNYKAVNTFVREGGEYFEKPMIEVIADGEMITPKSLYEYLKYKYKLGEEFTKQVIRDWVYDKISDDYTLTKNVSLN